MKPLGIKCYGSIPHHSKSRLGPRDYHCEPGQERIATEKARDKHDIIIVQEKVDGSNCSVAKVDGQILALTRSGYLASTSPYVQHHKFADWVETKKEMFDTLLVEKERIVGEWMIQPHGTMYELSHDPFISFDIMTGVKRLNYATFCERIKGFDIVKVNTYHIGRPLSLDEALKFIQKSGHGAIDPVEGVVWRVERKGIVDFLIKYVRPDKIDGKYLPEKQTGETVLDFI